MVKTYIIVHVHDDGDNELTLKKLHSHQVAHELIMGNLSFDIEQPESLKKELLSYGNEPEDIDEALSYILKAQPGESYIVGKGVS